MGLGGLSFGLFAERRPFGNDMLAHPLLVFFFMVGAALLIVRIALRRPVPDLIPERALLLGSGAGLVLFLAGNWISVNLLPAVTG